jgi:hypothetical protein
MTIWRIEPRTQFGPLELGMTIHEVHSIVGVENLTHLRISRYPGMSIDHCFDRSVEVLYFEDMRVCSINVTSPFCAEFLSLNLMHTPFSRLKEAVRREGLTTLETDDNKLILPNEGVLIWANDHNPEMVDTVSLDSEGLREEKERRFQQYRDEIRRDLASRSPGAEGLRERFHAKLAERAHRRSEDAGDSSSNGQ